MESSDERARVFVALALEALLGERVAAACEQALGGSTARRDFRLAHGAGLHLTLHFLGAVERALLGPLAAELAAALAGLDAPALLLAGTGAFPDFARARVLWVGVEECARAGVLEACQSAVLARLARADFDTHAGERQLFHPHVTVARPRRARTAVPETFTRLRFEQPWAPTEVVLMESVRSPGGSAYEVRARCALRAGGAKPA